MEVNQSPLSAYYQASPTSNAIFSEPSPAVFPTPASAPVSSDAVKRKRGRPRKYGPGGPSDAAASAPSKKKPTAAAAYRSPPISSFSPASSNPLQMESSLSKKSKSNSLGNAGQGFTPHVIGVSSGEDVAQKIMSFIQQRKHAVCILSASGSISNASLRQPAMLGGNVTYEGRFEILSLSGSYMYTEIEGASSRTGGLSVCLSGADGCIVGGGVGGPLKAAGPVQVIVGSFVIDISKDSSSHMKSEACGPVIGAVVSPITFRATLDPSARISSRGNADHHNIRGSGFVVQSQAMRVMHSGNTELDSIERAADGHHGPHQSQDGNE